MVKKKVEHLKDKKFRDMVRTVKSIDSLYELIAFIFAFRVKELLALAVIFLIVLNLYPEIADFILGLLK